jgi:hypothetical protein
LQGRNKKPSRHRYNDVEKVALPDSVYDLSNKVRKPTPPAQEGMDLDSGDSVQG